MTNPVANWTLIACGECRHWEPPEDPEGFDEGGRCLRYPPVYDHDWAAKHSAESPEFSAGNSYVFWAWPVTLAYNRCGEFAALTPKEAP